MGVTCGAGGYEVSREIKFRAWDKHNSCWYQPVHEAYKGKLFELLVSFNGRLTAHVLGGVEDESLWPDRFVLMQYTGLKDKNGKEIYEGDILPVIKGQETRNAYVSMTYGAWCISGKDATDGLPINALLYEFGDSQILEVIGNIHENPELLK
jgi:uncharacterized phage protein (TIGR01671 family)